MTPGHAFALADGTFREIALVGEDEHLVLEDGTPVPRPTIAPFDGLHTVYNFEVEEHHTYIAGGWRVHNDSVEIAASTGSTIGGIIADQLIRQFGVDNFALNITACTFDRALDGVAGRAIHDIVNENPEPVAVNEGLTNLTSNLAGQFFAAFGAFGGGLLADQIAPGAPEVGVLFNVVGTHDDLLAAGRRHATLYTVQTGVAK